MVLNFGSTKTFTPPKFGTMTFADGVQVNFADAFMDRDGVWRIATPAYSSVRDTARVSPARVDGQGNYDYFVNRGCGSPIAVDLDRSGAIELQSGSVSFDIDGDGTSETLTEWFGPNDGILVDRAPVGPATGAHLFGDEGGRFSSGYEKLAVLDANGDGEIGGSELNDVGVWVDRNANAKIDWGEMRSARSHGVVALSVDHVNDRSTAEMADAEVVLTEDIWFGIE